MKKNKYILVFAVWLILPVGILAWAGPPNEALSQIERMASAETRPLPELGKSIAEMIERDPTSIADALLNKLDDQSLSSKQLAVYVWALSHTKDARAVKPLIALYKSNRDENVGINCLHALAMLGGSKSAKFLLETLDQESDRTKRSDLLNLLAQMQVSEALPKTEELLKLDFKSDYLESVFVFGKFGDAAVPFLLNKVHDKDRNVRANAIHVLGQWLIPVEATEPLAERYWLESDKELRLMILSSLERTTADPEQAKTIFGQIVSKEQDPQLAEFARETVESLASLKTEILSFNGKKRSSPDLFRREYDLLFKSSGKRGNYDVLATSTAIEDERQLKSLRERILQRDSDESFYDYQRVNRIIMFNRLSAKLVHQ
jgi:hypothetical protein